MRLLILDHLQPVLDAAKRRVMIGQARRDIGFDPPRRRERGERVDSRGNAQRRVAPAIDELVDLREKLALANDAGPDVQVEAGAASPPLWEMSWKKRRGEYERYSQ